MCSYGLYDALKQRRRPWRQWKNSLRRWLQYDQMPCWSHRSNGEQLHEPKKDTPMAYVDFYNILDIASVNGYITWLLRNPSWNDHSRVHRRSIFLKELAYGLMEPWIRLRSDDQAKGAMRATVRRARELCLNEAEAETTGIPLQQDPNVRRRCYLWQERCRVRTTCSRCNQATCMAHGALICGSCL